jgi:hypothetical protein
MPETSASPELQALFRESPCIPHDFPKPVRAAAGVMTGQLQPCQVDDADEGQRETHELCRDVRSKLLPIR